MEVTTWKGGESYGIRVGRTNAEIYFKKEWSDVDVKIGGKFYSFPLNLTFWTTCPEFRGGPIPKWLQERGLQRWKDQMPYILELKHLGNKRFELSEPGNEKRTKGYTITFTD